MAATDRAPAERKNAFAERGIEMLEIAADRAGRVDLRELLAALGKRETSSLLVEGGAAVITSFIKENLADRLVVILSPKLAGAGINSIGDLGIRRMDDALGLSLRRVSRRGDDIILDARFKFSEKQSDSPPPGCRRGRS